MITFLGSFSVKAHCCFNVLVDTVSMLVLLSQVEEAVTFDLLECQFLFLRQLRKTINILQTLTEPFLSIYKRWQGPSLSCSRRHVLDALLKVEQAKALHR